MTMDKDRVSGTIKEVGGKGKEAWGDATDQPDVEFKGQAEQAQGKLQRGWGEAKDQADNVMDHGVDDSDDDG